MSPLLFWTWLLCTRVFADMLLRKPTATARRRNGQMLGVRQMTQFEQSVARGDTQEKTCLDLGLSPAQYAAAFRDWNELIST